MSLVESYAAERRARLVRLGRSPTQVEKVRPKKRFEPIDPAPFYRQMWMWDLVSPGGEPPRPKPFQFSAIIDTVCRYFLVSKDEILSPRMTSDVVYPRQICYWLVWRFTNASSMRVGLYFHRDHATVLHGQKKIKRLIREDWTVAYDIAHLEAML